MANEIISSLSYTQRYIGDCPTQRSFEIFEGSYYNSPPSFFEFFQPDLTGHFFVAFLYVCLPLLAPGMHNLFFLLKKYDRTQDSAET